MSDSKKDSKAVSDRNDGDINFHQAFSDFFRNDFHTFVVRKAEKLASALYTVTGFIPQEDPLRTCLRSCAVELVSASADPAHAGGLRHADGFAARCLEIGSALSLAQRSGFVSSMNSRILCDEYADLASFVKRHQERVFGGGEAVEVGERLALELARAPAPFALASAGHTKATLTLRNAPVKRTRNSHKGHSDRKDTILRLLDKKDKITIKDAMNTVEGCSEKTIQRELISLVESGVLVREGARRWSTYRRAG